MGEHKAKFAGVMLGHRRRDVYLSDGTRIAVVDDFKAYPDVVAMEPAAFYGTTKAQDEDGHVNVGDDWRVCCEIVDLVESEHGYLTWAVSKTMVEGTNRHAGVVACPVCWAWDQNKRLVAIVAPLMPEAKTLFVPTSQASA